MIEKYSKNIDCNFPETLQETLLTKTISVIGCGGNGGYILEYLARLGVKSLIFWDGDNYSESNLNRQNGCIEETIGCNKAKVMADKLHLINSDIKLFYRDWYFGQKDEDLIDLVNSDMIIMALDDSQNIEEVRDIVKIAIDYGIPCIDEFLTGLGGEISVITNNDLLWNHNTERWITQKNSNPNLQLSSQPAYKCALIAAETVNQMVQYFNNNPHCANNYKLTIDIYHHKYRRFDQYGEF